MIEKVFIKFFEFLDVYSQWVDDTFFPHKKNCKCDECKDKKKRKPSPEDLFNGE